MDKQNSDIDPPEDYVADHPGFRTLLVNEPLSKKFAERDKIAVATKRQYTRLGILSLAAAFVTFTALIFALTLDEVLFPAAPLHEATEFRWALAIVGAFGLGMQLVLLFSPLKEKWLGARFIAERVRCLKFQAFHAAACAGADQEAAVERYTRSALAEIAVEAAQPVATMRAFDADRAISDQPPTCAPIEPAKLEELKAMYLKLRVNYQARHAGDQAAKLKEKQKLPAGASEITFWAGIAIGYIDAIASVLVEDAGAWQSLLHFLTLELFMLSALLFVRERGSAFNAAIERYEDYKAALTHVAGKLSEADTAPKFVACVREAERAAMRELKMFCRETEKSTYLF